VFGQVHNQELGLPHVFGRDKKGRVYLVSGFGLRNAKSPGLVLDGDGLGSGASWILPRRLGR
jgi:hypothetical protein